MLPRQCSHGGSSPVGAGCLLATPGPCYSSSAVLIPGFPTPKRPFLLAAVSCYGELLCWSDGPVSPSQSHSLRKLTAPLVTYAQAPAAAFCSGLRTERLCEFSSCVSLPVLAYSASAVACKKYNFQKYSLTLNQGHMECLSFRHLDSKMMPLQQTCSPAY